MFLISKLILKRFRSIREEETIDFTKSGKNLLIYGENGSGKSTVCLALLTFFETADQRKKNELGGMAHIYLPAREKTGVSINVEIINTSSKQFPNDKKEAGNYFLTLKGHSANKDQLEFLREANRFKGYLDYRNLLKTYLIETKSLNLFSLIVDKIFERTKNPETKRQFGIEWDRISEAYKKRSNHTAKEKLKFKEEIESFSDGLKDVLGKIEPDVNRILKRFDPLMSVYLTFSKIYLTEKGNFGGQSIGLIVQYDDQVIQQHQDFFNEARLSALGLSLYLASFLYHKNEPEYENAYKLLLLDDIFIGMDMGNRIPLLKILEEDFADYQIIMTTYDQIWFNVARFYLPASRWKQIKFYVNSSETPGQYYTTIVDEQDDSPIQLALKYYKLKDYQACANYQRKALERQIKILLPEPFRKELDVNGNIVPAKKLANVYNRLLQWLKESGFDTESLEDFNLYAKVILNPLSHDNEGSPIFRQELESVFNILSELEKIKSKVLIHAKDGACLKGSYQNIQNQEWHIYKIILQESLWRIEWEGEIGYPPCLCRLSECKVGTSDWQPLPKEKTETIQKIHQELQNKHGIKSKDPFEAVFKNNKSIAVKSLRIEQ